MVQEVAEGRGAGPHKDYVLLDCTHLGAEVLETKLPDITEFARTYLGVDPVYEPVPVMPTAHYAMGGIPTNVKAEVLRDNDTVVPGLYAAGECACVSVHGSNRLGTNSLLDINVFGKRAGNNAVEYVKTASTSRRCPTTRPPSCATCVESLRDSNGTERIAVLRKELQDEMDRNAQVFRTDESLAQGDRDASTGCASATRTCRSRTRASGSTPTCSRRSSSASCSTSPRSSSSRRATARRAAAATCATTSRSATTTNYMKHTMAYLTGDPHSADAADHITLDWKPVVITDYQPMERKY